MKTDVRINITDCTKAEGLDLFRLIERKLAGVENISLSGAWYENVSFDSVSAVKTPDSDQPDG